MDQSIFRAYDIRGGYPEQINAGIVQAVMPAVLKALNMPRKGVKTLVLGHDARLSSPELYQTCREVLEREKGVRVIQAGLITTPMLYFLVNEHKAAGGIVVTASHNPKEYNGLKMVREKAIPVNGKDVLRHIK